MPGEQAFKTVEFKYRTAEERKSIIIGYESQGYEVLHYLPSMPPTVDENGVTVYSMQLYMSRMD